MQAEREKTGKDKGMLLAFFFFPLLSYLYPDLENWLAGWLQAYLDVFLKIKSINEIKVSNASNHPKLMRNPCGSLRIFSMWYRIS